MDLDELKIQVAKLSPKERFALAEWTEGSDDVRVLRSEELAREIQRGVEQVDRGELLEADEVFSRLRGQYRPRA